MVEPYYGPNEDFQTILLERSVVVIGPGYGIQVVLYIICARYLWSQRKARGVVMLRLLAYITLLIVIESLSVAATARATQELFVDNRNYPGGPWQYFLATQYFPEDVLFYVALVALTFLSDLLVPQVEEKRRWLWLCQFCYSLDLSSTPAGSWVMLLCRIIGCKHHRDDFDRNSIGDVPQCSTGQPPRQICRELHLLGHHLYRIFSAIFNIPISQIFLPVASSSQEIAGYLIIYRVAQGRAWRKGTLATHTLSLPTIQPVSRNHQSLKGVECAQKPYYPDNELTTQLEGDSTSSLELTSLKLPNNNVIFDEVTRV
ncbi:hypothetical protein AMATHDRAFT_51461 [Amanita thiersii Skay4041]|uniref:Uncharacterized protein n=1 Tax=Amanita thiersii Skay4041 TaxID=703135 RepID=A0A2A9NDJ9_9AGAR|nr:hypothetical protein AMATHDRAFT_51461 [Amanita thiersii Skay4041]